MTYQKNQTELVVLVTPVLVHAIDPADVTPVPGEHWRDPNPLALYFLGDMGGEVAPPPRRGPTPNRRTLKARLASSRHRPPTPPNKRRRRSGGVVRNLRVDGIHPDFPRLNKSASSIRDAVLCTFK